MLRAFLKDLLPPAIVRTVRRVRTPAIAFHGDFATFAEARAHATGYDNPAIAQASASVVQDLSDEVDARAQQVLAGLAPVRRPMRMLDVGGANGHYGRLVGRFVDCTCTVLETPEMVKANRHFGSDRLSFVDSSQGLGEFDVVLMSGVL